MALGLIWNNETSKNNKENVLFFDIKRFMADKGADMEIGNGVVLDSENPQVKKYLKDFARDNDLNNFLRAAVEDRKYFGRVLITIDKTKTGDFRLSYATPELLQKVYKMDITPFMAKIMKRKVIGDQVWFITEIWTRKVVERSLSIEYLGNILEYDNKRDGNVPKELQLPVREVHNLGFVPFIDWTNKPAYNLQLGLMSYATSQQLADDWPVRNLPDSINHSINQHYKDKILGKGKAYGQWHKSKKGNMTLEDAIISDALISSEMTGDANNQIKTEAGYYDGKKWTEPLKDEINLYAIGCGYSDIFNNGNAQTEAETLYSKDGDQRKTIAANIRNTELLKTLIARLLVYKGLFDDVDTAKDNFTLDIKETVVYNRLQMAEFLNNSIQYGLMTKLEAIMMNRGIDDKQEAQQILDQIEKEQQEQQEKDIEMMNAAGQQAGEQSSPLIGNAGPGKDPQQVQGSSK